MTKIPKSPKIFDQKNRGHCSGYSILAFLYNSGVELDYDAIDAEMQSVENAMMSFRGGFNFFARKNICKNFVNLSLEDAKNRLKNNLPIIVTVPAFGQTDAQGIVTQDFSQVMGGHVVCAVAMAENKGEDAVKFQNSWGENWGENGFGHIKIHKGLGFYVVE